MPSLLRRALRPPLRVARGTFERLPDATQRHARSAVMEGAAALRSLADGASDATERAIDRISDGLHGDPVLPTQITRQNRRR
jgi:hypothetical protein